MTQAATTTVKLSALKFGHTFPGASLNARVTQRDAEIDTLAASIRTDGLLQSLLVCPAPSSSNGHRDFYVIAGNRRLAALQKVHDDGADPDVPVIVRDDVTPGTALALSLSENITQVPLHPVDRYEAFAAMLKNGKSEADIAAQYAISRRTVSQSLALGALHQDIRKSWRDGAIDAEVAQAFTLERDPKRQAAVFKELLKDNSLWKRAIRNALIGKDGEAASRYLTFVGVEAYEKAGGTVLTDFFTYRHGCTDPALAKRLADEKLKQLRAAYEADGWSWTALDEELPAAWSWGWAKIDVDGKPTKDEKLRLKEIDARLKALGDIDDEIGSDEARDDEVQSLEAEQEGLRFAARMRALTPEHRAKSGIVLDLDAEGRLEIKAGIIKPAELKAVADADLDLDDRGKKKTAKAKTPEQATAVSAALNQRLSETLTAAAGEAIANEPSLAMRAIAAGIAAEGDCVDVREGGLAKKIKAPHGRASNGSFASTLETLTKASDAEVMKSLAQIAASALDFQELRGANAMKNKGVATLVNALSPKALNAALRKSFDAKDYFSSVSSALRLIAIEEALGADAKERASKLKKGEQTALAVREIPKTGWLPLQLRTAHYDGPGAGALTRAESGNRKSEAGKQKAGKRATKKTAAKKPAKR